MGILRRQDIKWCTVADLNGTYQFELTGPVLPPVPFAGPFARLGRLVGFGDGNFAVTSTASYNGAIVVENFPGTYTVTSDCRFEMKATLTTQAGPFPIKIEGTFADKGKTASLIVSEPPGAAITGTLKVQ
jgi:hypothetical protein